MSKTVPADTAAVEHLIEVSKLWSTVNPMISRSVMSAAMRRLAHIDTQPVFRDENESENSDGKTGSEILIADLKGKCCVHCGALLGGNSGCKMRILPLKKVGKKVANKLMRADVVDGAVKLRKVAKKNVFSKGVLQSFTKEKFLRDKAEMEVGKEKKNND